MRDRWGDLTGLEGESNRPLNYSSHLLGLAPSALIPEGGRGWFEVCRDYGR